MGLFDSLFGKKRNAGIKTCPTCKEPLSSHVRFCPHCGTEFKETVDQYDCFISYRRDHGSHAATVVKLELEKFGKYAFLDVDEMQTGRFDEQLLYRIEHTPNFLIILSEGCLDRCKNKSDWLKREIVHAFETNRTIIPIIVEPFSFPEEKLLNLLPEVMKTLPNYQAVHYNHVDRIGMTRKILGYMVEADEANASKTQRKPHGHTGKSTAQTVRHTEQPKESTPRTQEEPQKRNSDQKKSQTGHRKEFRPPPSPQSPEVTGKKSSEMTYAVGQPGTGSMARILDAAVENAERVEGNDHGHKDTTGGEDRNAQERSPGHTTNKDSLFPRISDAVIRNVERIQTSENGEQSHEPKANNERANAKELPCIGDATITLGNP